MKSVLGLFLFFLLTFSIANAQTKQELKNPDLSTFNINFINGYGISYNYLTTDYFWLRAQLDLYTYGQDIEGETDQSYKSINGGYYGYGSRSEGDENSDNDYIEISLSTQILFPLYKSDYGFIYFGAGPIFTYSNQSTTSDGTRRNFSPDTVLVPSINKYSNESNYKNYDLGILGLFGVSAAITDNISLYAETNFSGGLRWSESNYNNNNTYDTNYDETSKTSSSSNGWFYDFRFVRLGVTVSL